MTRRPDPIVADPDATAIGRLTAAVSDLHVQLLGMVKNHVLGTETFVFPSDGVVTRDYREPFAAVKVVNLGSAAVVLTTDPPRTNAPAAGPGVALTGAGCSEVHNVAGTVLTLYGIAGESVTVSMYDRPQPATSGSSTRIARPVVVPSTAIDVQAVAGAGVLCGYAIRENGAAAAELILRDGTTSAGAELACITLVAGESVRDLFVPPVAFSAGLFVDRISGTFKGTFYVGGLP